MRILVCCTGNSTRRNFEQVLTYYFPQLQCDVYENNSILQHVQHYDIIFVDSTEASFFDNTAMGDVLFEFVTKYGGTVVAALFTNLQKNANQHLAGSHFASIHPFTYAQQILFPSNSYGTDFAVQMVEKNHMLVQHFLQYELGQICCAVDCRANANAQVLAVMKHNTKVPFLAVQHVKNGCVIALNTTLGSRMVPEQCQGTTSAQVLKNCALYHMQRRAFQIMQSNLVQCKAFFDAKFQF